MSFIYEVQEAWRQRNRYVARVKKEATAEYNSIRKTYLREEKERLLNLYSVKVQQLFMSSVGRLTIQLSKTEPLVSSNMHKLLKECGYQNFTVVKGNKGFAMGKTYIKFFIQEAAKTWSGKTWLGNDLDTCQEKPYISLLQSGTPSEFIEREVFEWKGRWSL